MKKIFAYLVAAGLLVGVLRHDRVSERNSYGHMQEQTVLIQASSGTGSGVVIARGNRVFVWTANHVVDADSAVVVKQFIRTEGRKVGEVSFRAKLIGRDVERDLALFWLDAPVGYFRAAVFSDDNFLTVGTALAHVGHVMGSEFDGSVSTGVLSQIGVSPEGLTWPWKHPTDQGTFSAFYGGSGGPVFHNKKVVGILVGGLVGRGYINYVPVREISVFARKSGLSWAIYGSRCPSDEVLNELVKRSTLFSVN